MHSSNELVAYVFTLLTCFGKRLYMCVQLMTNLSSEMTTRPSSRISHSHFALRIYNASAILTVLPS